ncbi:MAG TPA: DoxX family protein [Jiangellaceae bacterium]|nr:DoxX family protein [Jiangellaceae bacterium]
MSLVRFVARPMLASIFLVQGLKTLRDPDSAVSQAKPVTDRVTPLLEKHVPQAPTDPRTLVRINAAVHVGAGALLATGTFPRLASLLLAGSMVPTTIAGYPFWQGGDPEEKARLRQRFLENVGITGGLLLAAVDTEGRPGLGWRARHAATDAKRAARGAKREAKLTARAAKAEVRSKAHKVLPGR